MLLAIILPEHRRAGKRAGAGCGLLPDGPAFSPRRVCSNSAQHTRPGGPVERPATRSAGSVAPDRPRAPLGRECNDPLLDLERRAYLGAIRDALAGVDAARAVLAKARQRLERESGQRGV
jgi:hypothetical protein